MGELFDQVCSETILFDAWRRVERKGSQGGIDQITISEFRQRLQHNLERLRDGLLSGWYVPEPFQKLEILKFDAPGETRPLQLPPVRDKIAQEAVRSIIAPILDKAFADCSYAYRPGKGPHKAIRRVEHYLEAKKHWVAVADIDRFFDTMDQQLTLDEVRKHVPEPEILRLLALDLVSSLLNYGYGMLYPRVHHALMLAGLNPCISFLHSFQEDKPTLSFDLIEEFRAQAVDRVMFGMINKGERVEIDHKTGRLTKETVQKLIQNVLERLATPIRHRRQDKPLQEIIQLQAKLLAAHLHGKARYRPFIGPW
jgi:hypothetical protein